MLNIYIDPNSYAHLNNALFKKDSECNLNDLLRGARFLKNYCEKRGISLNTIDLWSPAVATDEDIYASSDHKRLARKIYWKFKNKNYPIINLKKFKRKILFHYEPPNVMPEICCGIKGLTKIYDKVFFTWKTGISKIHYFHFTQSHDGIFSHYWKRSNRKFLTMINSNRKTFFRHKELLTERIKAITFFGKTNDIDLYGFDWQKLPLFPHWFRKGAVKKVYKGVVKDKYQKLSEYKFAFAIESCELPGYITDKIFDCFLVGTIPIYYGAPDVEKYIPENCFIDRRDFKNYTELRNFLKSLSGAEIQRYKENGRKFLKSGKYKPYTKEHFAKIFVEACVS